MNVRYTVCALFFTLESRERCFVLFIYLFVNVVRFDRGNCCACCLHKKYQKRIIIWHLLFRENHSRECCIHNISQTGTARKTFECISTTNGSTRYLYNSYSLHSRAYILHFEGWSRKKGTEDSRDDSDVSRPNRNRMELPL